MTGRVHRIPAAIALVLMLAAAAVTCEPPDPRGPDGWRTSVPHHGGAR